MENPVTQIRHRPTPYALCTTHRRSRAENQNQAKENPATHIRHRPMPDALRTTPDALRGQGQRTKIQPWKIQPRISDTARRSTLHALRSQGQRTKIKPWKIQPRKADTARRPITHYALAVKSREPKSSQGKSSHAKPTPPALRSTLYALRSTGGQEQIPKTQAVKNKQENPLSLQSLNRAGYFTYLKYLEVKKQTPWISDFTPCYSCWYSLFWD